ncbi:MAG: shikimate dehydrogenase [Betaproteobacteria bacterium]|nr:shikimate dehydrogenase [Betaproteobacteria bacterium]
MTDHYGVIGHPISHSKSPRIHAEFARQTGQDLDYVALDAPLDGFVPAVLDFRAHGGRGLNVTVPFKEAAYRLCATRTERAQAAGAVNTLSLSPEGIAGDNTDGAGLVRDLQQNLGFPLKGMRICLLGAGGAARGVLKPLLLEAPSRLLLVNRTPAKARALQAAAGHPQTLGAGGFDDLAGERFDLVINATAASLADELPPLPEDLFAQGAAAYDMMYGRETPFLRFARAHGAGLAADGIGMLVEQAAESFFIWRRVRPSTRALIRTLAAQAAERA